MSRTLVGSGIAIRFRWVKAGILVRRARICVDVAATQVIRDVSATVIVVRIVDQRFDLAIKVATRVNNVQTCNAAFNCQCREIELIHIAFGLKLRRFVLAETRIHQERALYIKFL